MYKYEEIRDKMLNDITAMQPHMKIKSRKALCMKYQVTRTTVDRAIEELIKRGFLYSRTGSGTYVSDQTQENTDAVYWGVILPGIVNQVYPNILEGIERFSDGRKINIIICNSENDPEKEREHIARLLKLGISGFIVVPCITSTPDYRMYRVLEQKKIPFVFCNRYMDGIKAPYVSSNSFYGGYLATRLLLERGARRIAFISQVRYKSSLERFCGYCAALENSGLPVDGRLALMAYDHGSEVRDFLKSRKPEAVFAFNDTVASVVYSELDRLEMKVGRDVMLIGYDNSTIYIMLPVKLTSVSYMGQEIGRKAAAVLYEMQTKKTYPDMDVILFQPRIIERQSTRREGRV